MSAYINKSESVEWGTPTDLFEKLDKEFKFTLDAAASNKNHKCARYFTKEDNALDKDWTGVVWLNPPYGRVIHDWIKKAYEEYKKGSVVVCLLPARTDTRWFHDYALKGEVRFIKGRLRFVRDDGFSASAPFGSVLVIFK